MNILGLRWDERGAASLAWRETRVPGVAWIPLHLEEERTENPRARGAACVLIRMLPGCGYTPHRHVGTEDVLVLAGAYSDEWGIHRQGDHVHYPAGSSHAPRALGRDDLPEGPSNPACVLFTSVPAGIELLAADPTSREATETSNA